MACHHLSSIPLVARRSIFRTRGFASSSFLDFALAEVLIPRNLAIDTLGNIRPLPSNVKTRAVSEVVSATFDQSKAVHACGEFLETLINKKMPNNSF
jgi:hypothetical protein